MCQEIVFPKGLRFLMKVWLEKKNVNSINDKEFSQTSSWKLIISGVLQGCVLGLSRFLIWINDLPVDLRYICKTFADSTFLFSFFSKIFEKHA